MMDKIIDFSPVRIKNASVQFIEKGQQKPGKKFGCMGTLDAETEMRELTKVCEGVPETIAIPEFVTVTIGAHIKRDVLRDVFGIKSDGLKEGIYSYGISSKGKRFTFTADVIDEFEDVVQLIAFPRCASVSGLSISVDNDTDEVPYVELELRANADDEGKFYYEAFIDEVDEVVKEDWHTNFTSDLVKDEGIL